MITADDADFREATPEEVDDCRTCTTCRYRIDNGEDPSTCSLVSDDDGDEPLEVDADDICDLYEEPADTVPAEASVGLPQSRAASKEDPMLKFGVIPIGDGPTSTDDGDWDGPTNEANLPADGDSGDYRGAFAWVDPDKNADTKAAYTFIHHEVNDDGEIGAANEKGCSSAIGVLNGGRGVDVKSAAWADDREGIYKHLTGHLRAAGVKDDDLPELDDMALVSARDNAFAIVLMQQLSLGKDNPEVLAAEIVAAMSAAELMDQFADAEHLVRQTRTPVSPGDLAARIAQVRERQEARPAERMRVKLREFADLEVELPVRWDPEAYDPTTMLVTVEPQSRSRRVSYGSKGAFIVTDDALTAAGDIPQLIDSPGGAWHAILCVEGLRTDEDPGREIMPGACQFPDLPVSLRLQIEDEGGHWGAVTCGKIETMERVEMDGYNAIAATGTFSVSEHGQLAQLLVEEQSQRFISIDPRDCDMEIVEIEIAATTSGIGYIGYDLDDDDDDAVYDWWVRYTNLTIGAATIVATPALQQAVIAMADVPLPETPIAIAKAPPTTVSVTASGEPALPSRSLFDDPGFHVGDPRLVRQADGHYACPLTVDRATGHVYGHVAYWGARHTAVGERPPHSPTYAYFMTGSRRTAEGDVVAVGNLTMGCGHASTTNRSATAAIAHYDGGYGAIQMADVAAGEDDFGIWVSGVLCEGVTEEDVRRFESLGMSGDWRRIAGSMHLVAVLAVPVPGFPIAREDAIVASAAVIDEIAARAGFGMDGEVFALVAAGRVQARPDHERLAELERRMDAMAAEMARQAAKDLLDIL